MRYLLGSLSNTHVRTCTPTHTHAGPSTLTRLCIHKLICEERHFFAGIMTCAWGCVRDPCIVPICHRIISSTYCNLIMANQFTCITEHHSKLALTQTVIKEYERQRMCVYITGVCATVPTLREARRKLILACGVQPRGV